MTNDQPPRPAAGLLLTAALLASLLAALGSLWLSLGMDLKACPLCLYQRACILAVVGVLTVGVMIQEARSHAVALMALPAAAAAWGVGMFHNYLEYTGKLECPPGVLRLGTAPQQAVVGEAVVLILLVLTGSRRLFSTALSTAIGIVLAVLLIQSAPPAPKPKPPKGRFDMCRPVYPGPPSSERK